jgi:hypothetical protein
MGGQPGVNTQYHSELEVRDGIEFRGGYLTGTGTTFADVAFIQGSVFSPGHSPGQLTVDGTLRLGTAEDQTSVTQIEIGGVTPGDGFDQIIQSGGDGVRLGGTLEVSVIDDFQYRLRNVDSFEILTSDQDVNGSFANVANGARVITRGGHGAFVAHYGAGSSRPEKVVLNDFRAIGVASMGRNGANIVLHCKGIPEGTHTVMRSTNPSSDFQPVDTVTADEMGNFDYEEPLSSTLPRRFYTVTAP